MPPSARQALALTAAAVGLVLLTAFAVSLVPHSSPRIADLERRLQAAVDQLENRPLGKPGKYSTDVIVCIGGQQIAINVSVCVEDYPTTEEAAAAFRELVQAAQALDEKAKR